MIVFKLNSQCCDKQILYKKVQIRSKLARFPHSIILPKRARKKNKQTNTKLY